MEWGQLWPRGLLSPPGQQEVSWRCRDKGPCQQFVLPPQHGAGCWQGGSEVGEGSQENGLCVPDPDEEDPPRNRGTACGTCPQAPCPTACLGQRGAVPSLELDLWRGPCVPWWPATQRQPGMKLG